MKKICICRVSSEIEKDWKVMLVDSTLSQLKSRVVGDGPEHFPTNSLSFAFHLWLTAELSKLPWIVQWSV